MGTRKMEDERASKVRREGGRKGNERDKRGEKMNRWMSMCARAKGRCKEHNGEVGRRQGQKKRD